MYFFCIHPVSRSFQVSDNGKSALFEIGDHVMVSGPEEGEEYIGRIETLFDTGRQEELFFVSFLHHLFHRYFMSLKY